MRLGYISCQDHGDTLSYLSSAKEKPSHSDVKEDRAFGDDNAIVEARIEDVFNLQTRISPHFRNGQPLCNLICSLRTTGEDSGV